MSGHRLPPTVLVQGFDDETVLLDLESGHYFALEGAGARILELLREGLAADDIAARLAREYDAEPSRIRRDLDALLAELEELRLIAPAG